LLGFLKGIAVGILVAIVLFVINYSRIDVVRNRLSGRIYHSKVERSPAELAVMNRTGHRLQIFVLQGYIFFGTAERLLNQVREALHSTAAPLEPLEVHHVLLDFRLVDNIDSSALHAFAKLLKTAEREDVRLVLTHLNAQTAGQFETIDFFSGGRAVRFDHLDYGLEWCEEQLLAAAATTSVPADINMLLQEILHDPDKVAVFKTFLVPTPLAEGEALFRAGESSDCIYFIESGRLSILLPQPGGGRLRLRTMGAGTVIGEIGLYADRPRSADAMADRPSTLYRLTYQRFNELETVFPDIARQFHKYVVLSLARRMARDSEAMQVLLP
jgi:SulP family sulfate permease